MAWCEGASVDVHRLHYDAFPSGSLYLVLVTIDSDRLSRMLRISGKRGRKHTQGPDPNSQINSPF